MYWKDLEPMDMASFNEMERQLHHAAQFPAMAANAYLPRREDDSHANLGWEAGTRRLVGRLLPGASIQVQVAIQVPEWTLQLVEENGQLVTEAPMAGRNMEELRQWLAVQLGHLGFDENALTTVAHYPLPGHPLQEGGTFDSPAYSLLRAWVDQRTNAGQLLRQFAGSYQHHSVVRIWPHHFDTGLMITLRLDEAGQADQGLGAGWAMADDQFDQPYLYLYAWDQSSSIDYRTLPGLDAGMWSREGGWKGAFLTLEALLASDDQAEAGKRMLVQAADMLSQAMGLKS